MANDEPKSKKFKHSVISEHIYDINFQEQFFNNWHNYTAVKTDNLEIIPKPFRVCKISNFLKNDELMDEVIAIIFFFRFSLRNSKKRN